MRMNSTESEQLVVILEHEDVQRLSQLSMLGTTNRIKSHIDEKMSSLNG